MKLFVFVLSLFAVLAVVLGQDPGSEGGIRLVYRGLRRPPYRQRYPNSCKRGKQSKSQVHDLYE
ncbi:unnamed protein product [Plutella xylostella]|uniref:(diamondback moth) hypothetical protein n=1 Tax=Plutella xylostella TaxID=51655 RepID=A0A8S4GB17_PLUXY|nr:unnamed protein product [Plutella xylostella]